MVRCTEKFFFFYFFLLWDIKWLKTGVQKCIRFQVKPYCWPFKSLYLNYDKYKHHLPPLHNKDANTYIAYWNTFKVDCLPLVWNFKCPSNNTFTYSYIISQVNSNILYDLLLYFKNFTDILNTNYTLKCSFYVEESRIRML